MLICWYLDTSCRLNQNDLCSQLDVTANNDSTKEVRQEQDYKVSHKKDSYLFFS